MSVKVFDKITATTDAKVARPLPAPLAKLLAAAGVLPGGQIPLRALDDALAKLDVPVRKRLELKAELYNYRVIAP
jgi:hypothetical protein